MRAMRKNLKPKIPVPEELSSDDEFNLPYLKIKQQFGGLAVSSPPESDNDQEAESEDEEEVFKPVTKKNRNNRRSKRCKKSLEIDDEVEKSLEEVNNILGPVTVPINMEPPKDPNDIVFGVNNKNLDVNAELNRRFGPSEEDIQNRRKAIRGAKVYRKPVIGIDGVMNLNFKDIGLSMEMYDVVNEVKHFRYVHDARYQKRFREFLVLEKELEKNQEILIPNKEDMEEDLPLEIMLQYISLQYYVEEHQVAFSLLEKMVIFMQTMFHNEFRLNKRNLRLEYKFVENRAFHVALLKYAYAVSERAAHRTALEICKVLKNIDPTDPLAVILVMDIFALRAREHQWLIDMVAADKRLSIKLHNIQFSHALAHYHVAKKNKTSMDKADNLLQTAVLSCPAMVVELYKCIHIPLPECNIFGNFSTYTTSKYHYHCIEVYAKLAYTWWRERDVLAWLKRNVIAAVENYRTNVATQEFVNSKAQERMVTFRAWPLAVMRHLAIICDMAKLIMEDVPFEPKVFFWLAANPAPGYNIDRYKYYDPKDNLSPPFHMWFLVRDDR